MSKRIHHMGMTLSKAEHERFHGEVRDLSPEQHDALMRKLGVTKEQDEEWHRTHLTLGEQRARGLKGVDPLAVGAAFVDWCVRQGWIVRHGEQYFATKQGLSQVKERFDITLGRRR